MQKKYEGGQRQNMKFQAFQNIAWQVQVQVHGDEAEEPDPWYGPAPHGLHLPQLPHGAVLHHLFNPQQKWTSVLREDFFNSVPP